MHPSTDKYTAFLTGAGGFVGACLARSLVAQGHRVHLLVRRETNLWRLADIATQFVVHATDIRDSAAVSQAVDRAHPDVVYHLAAHGAYPAQNDRLSILTTNLLGTANLLDALATHDYRAFVHTGSSSEYGHKDQPMREDDVLEPRTDYGVAKAAATLLCQMEAHKGRPVCTVRIFSAYGPWDDDNRLVPYLMGCCLRGESPRVTSGGQPRDFIFVDDLLRLIQIAAFRPEARGRILNGGTGRPQTVRDMVETVMRVCSGGKLTPSYGTQPPRPGEPQHWVASIEATTRLTGWRPEYDLERGVREMWQWFVARAGEQRQHSAAG